MTRRYLYSLLVGVPGLVVCLLITYIYFGVAGGVLWIFIYRDNPWPVWTGKVVPVIFALDFLTIWLPFPLIGFIFGKRLEQSPALNKMHVLISAGLTILFILFMLSYRVSLEGIGL